MRGLDNVGGSEETVRLPPVVIATVLRGDGATGVETHSKQVFDYLHGLGIPCEVVTSFSFPSLFVALLFAPRRFLAPVLPAAAVAWYRWSHRLTLTASLRRRLRDGSPAVIYAQCPLTADAALRARRSRHQKVVLAVHFHGSQADEWADREILSPTGRVFRSIRRLERRVIPAVDGHVFVSDSARRGLCAVVSGIEHLPWSHIPNFLPDTPIGSRSSDEPVADLVTIGSLEPHKNHRYLLEVLAEAAKAGHHYSLDIVGDGSLRRDLSDYARTLGLASKVRFLGRREDPRSLLPGHKVYVHSSIRETGPLAVIEAMSVGLPVVASAVGEVPVILSDGSCGAIWPLDDPSAAANILIDLLGDEADLARMSRASRDRFIRFYTTEQVGSRLVAFFSEVAAGYGVPFEPSENFLAADGGGAMANGRARPG